ncbi:hypothetical protein Anas_13589, partial [Armadillidium nasatum]
SNSKMSLRTLIFNLKTQQPALINPWNSQQLSALYSAKLYAMFLKRALSLLEKDSSSCSTVLNCEDPCFIPVCKNIYKKRNVPSKECLFSRKPIPKVKVMRSKTVSRGANILIEIKSSPHPREREISLNSKSQPMSSLQKEQLTDSIEKPMVFHCGNYSRVKELLVDDPMWSSGSLSISPFGKSPKGRMDSHLSGRFLMVENTSKSSVMSSDCVRDLIMEHEKFACGNGETFSSNTNDKFKSPVVTTCRTYKESFDIKTDALDSAMTSPWKLSPSSILNLAPYLL